MKYRSKPKVVEAIQLRWTTWSEVCDFLDPIVFRRDNPSGAINIFEGAVSDTCGEIGPNFIGLNVLTANGQLVFVRHGDYVIKDSKPGTYYPCLPDVFALSYELLEDE